MDYPTLYRLPPAALAKPTDRHPGIRWKAFFTADLYANPLHDLADWVQDISSRAPSGSVYGAGRSPIQFLEEGIALVDGEDTVRYAYDQMNDLKIHHQKFDASISNLTPRGEIRFLLGHTASSKGKRHAFEFVCSESGSGKVCQFLLARGIPFKEYLGGTRSHLGRVPASYKEIQKIKKKHDIAW